MTMTRLWRWRLVAAGGGVLLLAGCGNLFTTRQMAASDYVLSAAETLPEHAAQGAAGATPSLVLLRPVPAAGLDSQRIAVVFADGRMDAYQGANWASELPQLVQDQVLTALRRSGTVGNALPDTAPFASDWQLRIDITHFEAVYKSAGAAPLVRVAWVATLGRRSDRAVTATLAIDQQQQADANQLAAVLRAFNAATAAALAQLDDWTGRQLAAGAGR